MLAALGIRLGVPKPGVRMAPSELLESVLGVGHHASPLSRWNLQCPSKHGNKVIDLSA